MTKATPQVVIAEVQRRSVFTAIIPGRRALGETWNRADVYWNDDQYRDTGQGWEVMLTPADAPADGRALCIPAAMTADAEMLEFIIGKKAKDAEYAKAHPDRERSPEEEAAWINKAWQEWCEIKKAHFRGLSAFGAGGNFQRDKVVHKNEQR